jgi:hypothetical protein
MKPILKNATKPLDIPKPFHKFFQNPKYEHFEKDIPHREDIHIDSTWKHITFLLDKSGSMCSFNQEKMVKDVHEFLKDQNCDKTQKISITIFGFNDCLSIIYDGFFDPDKIYIQTANIQPSGCTALTEATAFMVDYIGQKCSNWGTIDGDSRPGQVICATLTDGEENSSTGDWKGKEGVVKLKDIIEEHTNQWSWKFYFLGANIDSQTIGDSLGYSRNNCIDFHTSDDGSSTALRCCSQAIQENRGFSQEERTASILPSHDNQNDYQNNYNDFNFSQRM